jgi:PmbA protein
MEHILSLAKKNSEEAEVFQVTVEETEARFEANRLKQLHTTQQTSLALRIIRQGRLGYATATEAGDGQALVKNAVETSAFGMKAAFHLPGKLPYPRVDVFDKAVNSVPVDKMVALVDGMIASITRHTPGILCEGGVSRGFITFQIMNSKGGQAQYKKSFFNFGIEGTLIEGTDMLFVGDGDSSCHPIPDAGPVTALIIEQLELAKKRASAASKQMPVIFTPNGVASALISPLMSAFNGKTVLEGASPVGKKLGEQVFNEQFSLYDDPTVLFQPASRPCDDEGVPSQRTPLVKNGVVANFLYDLQIAALAGKKSTGNGSRSRGGLPSPSPSAFVLSPGKTTFADMVRDTKEGLVVEQLMGAGQGNVLGGDFSGNVLLGYKIENGKMVGRVKDTMVSGNIYQAFKDMTIGQDARWVNGFLNTPHLYCPGLSVASKG